MWHEARKQEKKIKGIFVDYRKRAERRQNFYEKIKADPTQFMQIHGRKCKIHLDPAQEDLKIMMPWQGQVDTLIDRFDVRAHLDFIPVVRVPLIEDEISSEERQCNYESYRILAQNDFIGITEDKFLHQLYLEEQFGVSAQIEIEKPKKKTGGAAIGYTYEDSDQATLFQQTIQSVQQTTTQSTSTKNDDDSDSDIDVDVAIEISKLDTAQAHELNATGRNYGMKSNDFYSFLTKDADEAETLRMAREEEQEKIMLSGRKSRRERRAQRDKRLPGRTLSPPSYAAKEPDPRVEEKNESENESESEPINSGKITYITSFGGEDELQPHSKISINFNKNLKSGGGLGTAASHLPDSSVTGEISLSYAEKVKQNLEKLKHMNNMCGHHEIIRKPVAYRRHRSRNRSRSHSSRNRSRSRSNNNTRHGNDRRSTSIREQRRRRISRSPSSQRNSRRYSSSSFSSSSTSSTSSSIRRRLIRKRNVTSRTSSSTRSSRSSSRSKIKSIKKYSSSSLSSSSSSSSTSSSSSSRRRTKSLQRSPIKKKSKSPLLLDKLPIQTDVPPPVKKYYGRKKEDVTSSEEEEEEEEEGEHEKDKVENNLGIDDNAMDISISEKSPSLITTTSTFGKTTSSTEFKGGTNILSRQQQSNSNPRDRLKKKMQILLNKQFKADKKAEIERTERQVQMQQEREDEMRELALKLRRRQRELRHKYGTPTSSHSNSGNNDSSDEKSRRKKKSHSPSKKRSKSNSKSRSRTRTRSKSRSDREKKRERDRSRDRYNKNRRSRERTNDRRDRERDRDRESDRERGRDRDRDRNRSSRPLRKLVDY